MEAKISHHGQAIFVLCRKKNNDLRMYVDYRQLNQRTKHDLT